MNNPMEIISQLRAAMQNPSLVMQRLGLDINALRNPQAAIQGLMNSGKMSQEQYNQFYQMAQQIQSADPSFAQNLNGFLK